MTSATPSTAVASPTPVVIPQTPLTPAQAWGNVQVTHFPLTFGNEVFTYGGGYAENAVTADDQLCGQAGPPVLVHETSQQLLQRVNTISLINLHTGELTSLYTMLQGYQMFTCATTGSWVIWSQVHGATWQEFLSHWQIWAYNRQTQELRLLDQSTLPNGQPTQAAIISQPSASNGYVVWTHITDAAGDTDAVLYNLVTKQQTVLASNASFPHISWPWVSWGDTNQKRLVFENVQSQQQVTFPTLPATDALNGTSFVMSDKQYSTITLYPSITSSAQLNTSLVIGQSINSDFVEYPTLNDRLVTWMSNYSMFVFDRILQRLVQFTPIIVGPQPVASQHFLLWQQPISAADYQAYNQGGVLHNIMYVIDTNQLPATSPSAS